MIYEAVLPQHAYEQARDHLLQHVWKNRLQEDLCFCLWNPSTGKNRYSAIITDIIKPIEGDRVLNGNAAFETDYLSRAVHLANNRGMGLAFMHNHFTPGWQDMSPEDIVAERDRIAPAAASTKLPLVGLTMGTDGSMSARLWIDRNQSKPAWCRKVRHMESGRMGVTCNESDFPPYRRRPQLQRTIDSWGLAMQEKMARLRIGIIGLGSVGAMVVESLARMGVESLLLIDADEVKPHNLDRLLHANRDDVNSHKVEIAERHARRAATAKNFQVTAIAGNLQNEICYRAALDCDLLFSCVDRPLPKDLLNHIAYTHCIPVVFGGIFIDNKASGRLAQANWSTSIIGPGYQCLRCDRQYTTSDVVQERDGTWDDPEYLKTSGEAEAIPRNQNVFPLSAHLGSAMVLEMVRFLIAEDWWPAKSGKTTHSFISGHQERSLSACSPHCVVHQRAGKGDTEPYPFIDPSPLLSDIMLAPTLWAKIWTRAARIFK